MRTREIELLDPDLDDVPEPLELGFSFDVSAADGEHEGEIGLRALLEHPEVLLRRARWSDAA